MRKWFNLATILLASAGIIGWKDFDLLPDDFDLLPTISFAIIVVVQLIASVRDNIVVNNSNIERYIQLRRFYISYFNRLEKLWLKYEIKNIDEQQAFDEYYILRESAYSTERIKDELHIKKLKNLNKHALRKVWILLENKHNVKMEQ
jgi:hypothetical protein